MNAVIDTNVVSYFVLGTEPFANECRTFLSAVTRAWAPALWEAELTNVLWMAARKQVITVEEALRRLNLAAGLGIESVPARTLWQGALVRAHQSGIAAYDTLFIELAHRKKVPLATFDAALLRTFPGIALRPSQLL